MSAFLRSLRAEIESHRAVNHVFLGRCATSPFTREDYRIFGLHHFPLVGLFTGYLERLLVRGPTSEAKSWLAKVLVDEYGERSHGQDHEKLYADFLKASRVAPGEENEVILDPAVVDFVRTHLRLVNEEPFLVGLGALGPGHEWSIPRMFTLLVEGLTRAGYTPHEIRYFSDHLEQDVDHGRWLEDALDALVDGDEAEAQVRRGAFLSLEARARLWDGIQGQVVAWRQPVRPWELRLRGRSWISAKIRGRDDALSRLVPVTRVQLRRLAGVSDPARSPLVA